MMNIFAKRMVAILLVALMATTVLFAQGAIEASGGATLEEIMAMQDLEDQETTTVELADTTTLEDGMLLMREEEKLARDVYLALYEKWGIRIFYNIARSEQRHMDSVATLMEMKEVADPVAYADPGVFTIPEIANLYSSLVEKGSQSIEEAFTVGAIIEDLDIADLDRLVSETEDSDAVAVYSRLLAGSENHMQSFIAQLARLDVAYEPQYISADRFEGIIKAR